MGRMVEPWRLGLEISMIWHSHNRFQCLSDDCVGLVTQTKVKFLNRVGVGHGSNVSLTILDEFLETNHME